MSRLRESLDEGKFVITCEVAPPKGTDTTKLEKTIEIIKPIADAVRQALPVRQGQWHRAQP